MDSAITSVALAMWALFMMRRHLSVRAALSVSSALSIVFAFTVPAKAEDADPQDQSSRERGLADFYARAFGAPPQDVISASYPLLLDGRPIGEVLVEPGDELSRFYLDGAALRQMLGRVLSEEAAAEFDRLVASVPHMGVSDILMADAGMPVTLNSELLYLEIDIPSGLRAHQTVSRSGDADVPEPTLRNARRSLIANFDLQHLRDERFGEAVSRNALFSDVAIREGEWLLQTGLSVFDDGDGAEIVRAPTFLTRDFPDRAITARLGDVGSAGRNYVGSAPLLGVTIERDRSLQPYRDVRPRFSQEFEVERPSVVRVLINGVVASAIRLDPGRYTLDDLPIQTGVLNDVTLEIDDGARPPQIVSFRAVTANQLLGQGIADFGITLGVNRGFDLSGQPSYDFEEPVLAGYYARGLTNSITASASGRIESSGGVASASMVMATLLGPANVIVAASDFSDFGSGVAGEASLQYTAPGGVVFEGATFSASYRSADFLSGAPRTITPINGLPPVFPEPGDPLPPGVPPVQPLQIGDVWQVAARGYGRATENISFTGGLGYEHDSVLGGRYQASVGGAVSYNQVSLSVSGDYLSRRSGGIPGAPALRDDEWTVRASLTYRPSAAIRSTVRYDSRSEDVSATVSARGQTRTGLWNATVGGRSGPRGDRAIGSAQYRGLRYEARANVNETFGDGFSSERRSTRLGVGTAIVMAEGHVGVSRPIRDSFLIVRSPSETAPVVVNRRVDRNGRESVRGQSGSLGPAVVSDVYSHSVVSVVVEQGDSADGEVSSVPSQRVDFQSARRGGAVYQLEGVDLFAMTGMLLDQDGEPLPLAVGSAVPSDGSATLQIFTNEAGRYYVEGLQPDQTYTLRLSAGGMSYGGALHAQGAPGELRRGVELLVDREN